MLYDIITYYKYLMDGEIKVGLLNTTKKPYTLEAFAKIAQIIIIPCDVNAKIVIGKPENDTLRGSNGFGSTGV